MTQDFCIDARTVCSHLGIYDCAMDTIQAWVRDHQLRDNADYTTDMEGGYHFTPSTEQKIYLAYLARNR